jgi:hypothetical protein
VRLEDPNQIPPPLIQIGVGGRGRVGGGGVERKGEGAHGYYLTREREEHWYYCILHYRGAERGDTLVLSHPNEGRQIGTIIPERGDAWVRETHWDYLTREGKHIGTMLPERGDILGLSYQMEKTPLDYLTTEGAL